MSFNNLSDRCYETTKLLRRSKGVFSKARRTLTSPPKFRRARLCGSEGFPTTAVLEKRKNTNDIAFIFYSGTVTPRHNWKHRNTDAVKAIACDWIPSLFIYKGTQLCKRYTITDKRFLPGSNKTCPKYRYISDRRPRGLSLQQPDVALCHIQARCTITLYCFLNGTAGYRTDSEDSLMSPGCYCRIRTTTVQYCMLQWCRDSRYMFGTEVYQHGNVL